MLHALGDELREARLASGLTQSGVASAIGSTRRRVSRIERGRAPGVGLLDLARFGGSVGLRLHARMYPAGPPLRDAAQVALLDRFRQRLSPAVEVRLEVPVTTDPRDQRAWDMHVRAPGDPKPVTIGIEAITRLRDVQAQVRAAQLKRQHADTDRLILLIAATHANRRALAGTDALIRAAFPIGTRAGLGALATGRDPGADALILL